MDLETAPQANLVTIKSYFDQNPSSKSSLIIYQGSPLERNTWWRLILKVNYTLGVLDIMVNFVNIMKERLNYRWELKILTIIEKMIR